MKDIHRTQGTLTSFHLEDFFDRYEHEEGLINLASSDALPWNGATLRAAGVELPDICTLGFGYPDVKDKLLPLLATFCNLPSGFGLLPTSGAAEAIALVMQHGAVTQSKESIWGLPTPSYGAFAGLARAHGLPVKTYAYQPNSGWKPDLNQIFDLSKECSVLVVVNPHNPTGHTIDDRSMRELASNMHFRGSLLVVDEVFRERGETSSAVGLGENVIVLGSLSKTYGLPGLRLGWIAAQEKRLSGLRTVQQY
jgi:histidinol-phosphate/aromatic aminotransferase/cobyric acid decarboxylase-like protein